MTASLWPHVDVPVVPKELPVTGKIEVPSVGSDPVPQIPDWLAVVCHETGLCGLATGTPTTQPLYVSQSPSCPPNGTSSVPPTSCSAPRSFWPRELKALIFAVMSSGQLLLTSVPSASLSANTRWRTLALMVVIASK